jgi:pimeloyl-ACP methyl ester carboxylesterase
MSTGSNISAPTLFLDVIGTRYAYRRFGHGPGLPLLFLQHFAGTLDNWDPAITDPLAAGREVILLDYVGVGRSGGKVSSTMSVMARQVLAFLKGLGVTKLDVLGFSLGGMVAQQVAVDDPSIFRRMILAGTAPRGGEDIMHFEKPSLARYIADPQFSGFILLQKIFFAPTESSQKAGVDFVARLAQRKEDLEPASGDEVMKAHMMAFRDWEQFEGDRFANLKGIRTPTLVVNGIYDEMIPVRNSYWLGENLSNAVLMTYPDSGHGSLFQFHESFTRHAAAFLSSGSQSAVY